MQADKPAVLIEAKAAKQNLAGQKVPHQLQRYFLDSGAEYAVFTNGLEWRWYRQNAVVGNHKLEQSPFLTHDVRYPSDFEIGWLLTISGPSFSGIEAKKRADESRMDSVFYEWIVRTRHNPSDLFIRLLIRETELGIATASRVQSAKERFIVTFENFISGETDRLLDAVRDSREERQNKEKIDIEPASEAGFQEESEIDLNDDGELLTSSKLERAWRIRGSAWQRAKSSQELQIAVVRYLASQDGRGKKAFYDTVNRKFKSQKFFSEQFLMEHQSDKLNRFSKVEPDLDVWMVAKLGNESRKKLIQELCENVETKDGRQIRVGDELQIWLPSLPSNSR